MTNFPMSKIKNLADTLTIATKISQVKNYKLVMHNGPLFRLQGLAPIHLNVQILL